VTESLAVDVSIGEWTTARIADVHLTSADGVIADRLRHSRQLEIVDLHEGLRVESRGWIGVVRLEACTIRVEPKLVDGHRNLVRLLDYVRQVELMKRLPPAAMFDAEGVDLFDLMASLMASACEDLLRVGVHADYMPQRDELTVLRGRLDVKAQALQHWGRVDRLVCDYDERVRDTPENRWLLRGLRVARRGVRSERIVRVVHRMCSTWDELCQDDTTEELVKPVITRTNAHYRHALELAYLLVGGVTASDVLRHGSIRGFSFFLNMPRLFEEFVSGAVEQIQSQLPIRVDRQSSHGSILWDAEEHCSYGRVRPDLMLVSRGGTARLPMDAKYKNYDVDKLSPGDVYQTAIYALTLCRGLPRPRCLLIYPAAPARRQQRVQVRVGGETLAEIEATGIVVPQLLDELGDKRHGPETRLLFDATRVAEWYLGR
jgi:5-methylcytosine-specific restriction enzyme subunit McrC